MELPKSILDETYTLEQVAQLLGLTPASLRDRIARGSDHPPFRQLRRGYQLFPIKEFNQWFLKKPLQEEVRGRGKVHQGRR